MLPPGNSKPRKAFWCVPRHSDEKFCVHCRSWERKASWDEHCAMHLARLKEERGAFCGFGKRLGLTIAPALCPFCLSAGKTPSERYRQFVLREDFLHHISKHDRDNVFGRSPERGERPEWWKSRSCPHPLCSLSLDSPQEYRSHFMEIHGIFFRKPGQGRAPSP
jgi:hypothetical protein